MGEADCEKLQENRGGEGVAGDRRSSGACKLLICPMIGQLWQLISTVESIIWLHWHRVYQTCPAFETLLYLTFKHFEVWYFDTKKIFKKMPTGSFLPYSHRFSLIRYFTACSLFSFSVLTESLAHAVGNGETWIYSLIVTCEILIPHN